MFMCIGSELAGKKVLAISGSEPVSIIQSVMPVASAEFSVVKDRVNNFVENSKILLRVLDEVGKAHPFIQGQFRVLHSADEAASYPWTHFITALILFKAGIQLEVTRRENDEKVLALNTTMCDMMSVLRPQATYFGHLSVQLTKAMNTNIRLKKVTTPEVRVVDGLTIEQRLSTRMNLIIASIKSCARLCDSYQRRHVARTYLRPSHYAP